MTEIHRVLKCGGLLIFSVPNLAAFHNRLLLLFGKQPSCIHIVGPHIRGYTLKELSSFLTTFDLFRLVRIRGSGIYPLPRFIAKFATTLFKTYSIYFILVLKKVRDAEGYTWMNFIETSLPRNVTNFVNVQGDYHA